MRDIAICAMRTFDSVDEDIELSPEQIELGTQVTVRGLVG
jgi:hypothetical protein